MYDRWSPPGLAVEPCARGVAQPRFINGNDMAAGALVCINMPAHHLQLKEFPLPAVPIIPHARRDGACPAPVSRRPATGGRRQWAWLLLPAMAIGLSAGSAASAQEYATRDVGDWTVAPSSDRSGCFLTRTYRGPRQTTLLFGLDTDGSNRLTLLNPNWSSIREKEELRLTYRFSGAAFPNRAAIGIAASGRKGFVTSFGDAFPRTLATSAFLHVRRGDVPVEELTLDGSGAAIAELRKCVDVYRATPAKATKAAKDDGRIPLDPFAAKQRRDSKR
ncbi:hypothetical protein [Sphingomonas sp. Ag1]|jgi:hypothetical protein|uniref:hypothetical protein n=1 Tax=Sphingomonas sp. Ag1 TaxID=1642949 RepID=UPI000B08B20A|nr:hypothetical protein [Sphingomonas sp. Ag1]